jgi:ribosomal protein L16/L10AE
MLKKFLKKLKRKGLKKQRGVVYKLYVSLSKNYMLSKKSKNSRMGKGKGSFIREAVKVKKFRPFIYSNGYRLQSLTKLAAKFSSKTNKKLSCFSSSGFNKTYS